MYRVSKAWKGFDGSCGHKIEAGSRFLVSDGAPQFHCAACGKKRLAREIKERLEELQAGKQKQEG